MLSKMKTREEDVINVETVEAWKKWKMLQMKNELPSVETRGEDSMDMTPEYASFDSDDARRAPPPLLLPHAKPNPTASASIVPAATTRSGDPPILRCAGASSTEDIPGSPVYRKQVHEAMDDVSSE